MIFRKPRISDVDCAAGNVVAIVAAQGYRKATKYLHPAYVVSACRRHRRAQQGCIEILVKVGWPNFSQRKFIKSCIAAKEPFPIKKIQVEEWKSAKSKKRK